MGKIPVLSQATVKLFCMVGLLVLHSSARAEAIALNRRAVLPFSTCHRDFGYHEQVAVTMAWEEAGSVGL